MEENYSNSGDKASKPAKGVPLGKYCLVGWGVHTTGRCITDEIYQLAAYTSTSKFSEYIMPFGNFNRLDRRKHSIRVVCTGKYRMLKDIRWNRYIKTKSHGLVLNDFLDWLEKISGDAHVDGTILIYHEIRKASPWMLLEALRKHNLEERFQKVVKGFVNLYHIAEAKCANYTKTASLRIMSQDLLNRDEDDLVNALDRARVSYQIAAHLALGERQKKMKVTTEMEPEVVKFVCPFVNTISAEKDEVSRFKVLLQRQNSFRPVFTALLQASRSERQRVAHLRRLLVENNIDYDKLKDVYDDAGKQGLAKILESQIENVKESELKELLNILDCFFDPEKEPVQPKRPKPQFGQPTPRPSRKSFSKDKNFK